MQKLLVGVVVAFAAFYLLSQPAGAGDAVKGAATAGGGAADAVKGAASAVGVAFESIIEFISALFA